ncbi:MAG: hypothetical protein NC826_02505 [Candidatus Omnitrophica bacterium]|nr:hypothetical protein [Candidatus Omnitrophota bacterium]
MINRSIELPFLVKDPILALGSHTKNTLCFAKGKRAFISSVHLDLDNWQDFLEFQRDLKFFLKKKPQVLVCDPHPLYRSTRIAKDLSRRYILKKVQHHHAHIASCMVENNLRNQKVIGVAFDGTGLGEDNTLWGAEFFLTDYRNFKRLAHLKTVFLPGADMAIKQPWRITFAWLYLIYKEKLFQLDTEFIRRLNYKDSYILKQILKARFNCPPSSSMGRLFDAVGTLILNRFTAQYEGEFPAELEKLAKDFKGPFNLNLKGYRFKIKKEDQMYIIDPVAIFKSIIRDIKDNKDKRQISFRFHQAVSCMVNDVCLRLREDTGINIVILTGGVFQNSILHTLILDLLYKNKFIVFSHNEIPCFDAGISLGQIAVGNFL